MAILIPVNNEGNREILQDTGGGRFYRFRTYFTQGQMDGWYLDIRTTIGEALLLGKRLVPGCPNLLKGQGDTFRDVQLAVVVLNGNEKTPGALGNGTYLYWMNPGEVNPFKLGDPLIDIPSDEWAFGDGPEMKVFQSDVKGKVYVPATLNARAEDPLATVDESGRVSFNLFAVPGNENEFFRITEDGKIVLKG